MALNIILTCLVAVNVLNFLLVVDLYNRSARLAKWAHDQGLKIRSLLHKVTAQ
jgi:hypothetical protein